MLPGPFGAAYVLSVARMERSAMRDLAVPDFASLHPATRCQPAPRATRLTLHPWRRISAPSGSASMSSEYKWPNGKRIAVSVTAMLETWSEGKAPPYSVQASPVKSGVIDHAGIAWGSYGGKVGVYRLINLFRENGIRATFGVNGKCAELYPEAVAQI